MPDRPVLTLARKIHEGGDVWSFLFEPSHDLGWIAGQFVRVELPHPDPDEEGTRRYFTITSAPHESVVQIATRLTGSTFKRALANLPMGGHLNLLDLPAGDFTWPANHTRPLLFVAQGIGITPFISMLRDRIYREQTTNVRIIHANLKQPPPFESELQHLAQTQSGIEIIFTNHPLTAAEMMVHCPDLAGRIVYVSGPKNLIELLGPPYNLPISSLKQDLFPNYPSAAY